MLRLCLGIKDVTLEVEPESRVGDWDLPDLPTLREDIEALAGVVKVLELDRLQRALTEAVVEQQSKRDSVPQGLLGGDDRTALVRREGRTVDAAAAGTLYRERGIAVQGAP